MAAERSERERGLERNARGRAGSKVGRGKWMKGQRVIKGVGKEGERGQRCPGRQRRAAGALRPGAITCQELERWQR